MNYDLAESRPWQSPGSRPLWTDPDEDLGRERYHDLLEVALIRRQTRAGDRLSGIGTGTREILGRSGQRLEPRGNPTYTSQMCSGAARAQRPTHCKSSASGH